MAAGSDDGRITDFFGDYEYYREKKREKAFGTGEWFNSPASGTHDGSRENGTQGQILCPGRGMQGQVPCPGEMMKKTVRQNVKSGKDEGSQSEELEGLIASLEAKEAQLKDEMQLCGDDYAKLSELYKEQIELLQRIEGLYAEWASYAEKD